MAEDQSIVDKEDTQSVEIVPMNSTGASYHPIHHHNHHHQQNPPEGPPILVENFKNGSLNSLCMYLVCRLWNMPTTAGALLHFGQLAVEFEHLSTTDDDVSVTSAIFRVSLCNTLALRPLVFVRENAWCDF
ncbi:hypothetical protein DMENIID0001_037670 [Sergentomyia squamirostris]